MKLISDNKKFKLGTYFEDLSLKKPSVMVAVVGVMIVYLTFSLMYDRYFQSFWIILAGIGYLWSRDLEGLFMANILVLLPVMMVATMNVYHNKPTTYDLVVKSYEFIISQQQLVVILETPTDKVLVFEISDSISFYTMRNNDGKKLTVGIQITDTYDKIDEVFFNSSPSGEFRHMVVNIEGHVHQMECDQTESICVTPSRAE